MYIFTHVYLYARTYVSGGGGVCDDCGGTATIKARTGSVLK